MQEPEESHSQIQGRRVEAVMTIPAKSDSTKKALMLPEVKAEHKADTANAVEQSVAQPSQHLGRQELLLSSSGDPLKAIL